MKILCVSDYMSSLIYSDQLKKRFNDVEIVLSSGDININYYEFIVSILNKPLLFVFGNHHLEEIDTYRKNKTNVDVSEYCENLKVEMLYKTCNNGGIYIDEKIKKIKGLIIAGLGGSMRYNDGLNQFSETGMLLKILKIVPRLLINKLIYGRYLDILITHAPPYGIHDQKDLCHRGFKSFIWFMKIFKPRYLIHGHIHLYDINKKRESKYLNTTVVNAYDHVVLNVEEKNGRTNI